MTDDRTILRSLAARVAEIAALPVQEEKRRLWTALNGLRPERPMVAIDQVCWHELECDDALRLRCEDPECREYERQFRQTLYSWEHFPVDGVVEGFVRVPKAVSNTGFGIQVQEHIKRTSGQGDVVSHAYHNQFQTLEDVEKIQSPVITHDAAETARRVRRAGELFGDLLEVRETGVDPYLSIWDTVSMWMGVTDLLYTMIDEPELMHAVTRRVADGFMAALDQLEEQGLLCHSQSTVHCTGAYTDELPAPGFDPARPRTRDIWMFGLAQVFATVSPAMFDEYEIEYSLPIFRRFGLVYYGCCDPLDGKMEQVRRIPNLRKVSMSPWADQRRGAEEIGRAYVFSRKPNPALLAGPSFDEEAVRRELRETRVHCEANGCPLEYILKDISTVAGRPQRLFRWAELAMEEALR